MTTAEKYQWDSSDWYDAQQNARLPIVIEYSKQDRTLIYLPAANVRAIKRTQ